MVQFHYILQAAYDALAPKNEEALYFTKDTQRIYRGSQLYADAADQLDLLEALEQGLEQHVHQVTHKPEGIVSQPTFEGTSAKSTGPTGSITVASNAHNHTYTPAGTVSKPTFTGTAATIYVPGTPAGSVSKPTFTGDTVTSGAASANTPVAVGTHNHVYTPAGTVSKPSFTGTSATSTAASSGAVTVNSITSVGTQCTLTGETANKCLTLTYTHGAMPTFSAISVVNASHTHNVTATGSVSQPIFTGSEGTVQATSSIVNVATYNHTHSVKATGTISQPSFTGTAFNIPVEYKPAGTISQPTFTGTTGTTEEINGTVSVPSTSHTHNVTATGTVSRPTFSGTSATFTTTAPTIL